MSDTIAISQLGARMHYAVPRILQEAGRLERLFTDLCATKGWPRALCAPPAHVLPASLRRLRGRVPYGIPADKITCFPVLGVSANLRRTIWRTSAQDTKVALSVGHAFSRAVVRHGFGGAAGFYGISGECLEQLQVARAKGLWTAVEQIIAPRAVVDRLIAGEAARYPQWQMADEPDPLAEAFAAREKEEWRNADLIVCPSEFVLEGVGDVGGPAERCVIVPYGVDARFRQPPRPARRPGPLRVLTVGAVGLRKGSPYVLEAARRLKGRAHFRMVGPLFIPGAVQEELRRDVELTGPVPRAEMAGQYAWADVFLLPSVCEGSATVTYEALAAGLPVVTTPNTGSVVRDGVDGFICAAGDSDTICDRLERLARDRDLLESMAREAVTASFDHDVAAYGRRLLAALDGLSVKTAQSIAPAAE